MADDNMIEIDIPMNEHEAALMERTGMRISKKTPP